MTIDPTRAAEIVRARAIEIVQAEARELGYCDDDITSIGWPDGEDLLAVQAVERAWASLRPATPSPVTDGTVDRDALSRIADLGSCANGRTPAYKLFQQAIDIAVEALASTPQPAPPETVGREAGNRLYQEARRLANADPDDNCPDDYDQSALNWVRNRRDQLAAAAVRQTAKGGE